MLGSSDSRLSSVQSDLDEAHAAMRENIELVVDRGEQLTALIDKSDSLSSNARNFNKQSSSLRSNMWYSTIKNQIYLAAAISIFVLLLMHIKCGFMLRACRA